MNSSDIWQRIFSTMDSLQVIQLRILSKMHLRIGEIVLKKRKEVIKLESNDTNAMTQLLAWIYMGATMKSMSLNPHHTDDSLCYIDRESPEAMEVENDWQLAPKLFTYDIDLKSYDQTWNDNLYDYHDGDDPNYQYCQLLKNVDMDSVFKTSFVLSIVNKHGINFDVRGVKSRLEFADFHRNWKWAPGYVTMKSIVEGCFRVKSHKFDNWYETIHGCREIRTKPKFYSYDTPFRINDSIPIVEIELSVDHGS